MLDTRKFLLALDWVAQLQLLPHDSLKTLAFVSHAVADTIHPKLFSTVIADGLHRVNELQCLLTNEETWRHARLVRRIVIIFHPMGVLVPVGFSLTRRLDPQTMNQLVQAGPGIADILSALPLLLHVELKSDVLAPPLMDLRYVFEALGRLDRLKSLTLVGAMFDGKSVPEATTRAVGSKLESLCATAGTSYEDRLWTTIAKAARDSLQSLRLVGFRKIQPGQDLAVRTFSFPALKSLETTHYTSIDPNVIESFISRHPGLQKLECDTLTPFTAGSLHSIEHLRISAPIPDPLAALVMYSLPQPYLLRKLYVRLILPIESPEKFADSLKDLNGLEELTISGNGWFTRASAAESVNGCSQSIVGLLPSHPTLQRVYLELPVFPIAHIPIFPIIDKMNYRSPTEGDTQGDDDIQRQEENVRNWPYLVRPLLIPAMEEYAKSSPCIRSILWTPFEGNNWSYPHWDVSIEIERGTGSAGDVVVKGNFAFSSDSGVELPMVEI